MSGTHLRGKVGSLEWVAWNVLHAMCCMAVVEERQCGCRHGAAVVPGHGHGIYARPSSTPICHLPRLPSPFLSSPYLRLSVMSVCHVPRLASRITLSRSSTVCMRRIETYGVASGLCLEL